MRRNLLDLPVMASLVLAIAFSAPAIAQQDSNREQMIDMVLQIQQLQDEQELRFRLLELSRRLLLRDLSQRP